MLDTLGVTWIDWQRLESLRTAGQLFTSSCTDQWTHAANQEGRTESTRVLFLPPLISPASMGPLTIGKITILRLISTAACLRSAWVKCRLHPAY